MRSACSRRSRNRYRSWARSSGLGSSTASEPKTAGGGARIGRGRAAADVGGVVAQRPVRGGERGPFLVAAGEGPGHDDEGALPQAAGQHQQGADHRLPRGQRDGAGDHQLDGPLQADHQEPLPERGHQPGQVAEDQHGREQQPAARVRGHTAHERGHRHAERGEGHRGDPGPRCALEGHEPGGQRAQGREDAVLQVPGGQAERQRRDHPGPGPQGARDVDVRPPERAEVEPAALAQLSGQHPAAGPEPGHDR